LIGSSSQLFIDVVIIAEKIEQTILKRGFTGKRKEIEVYNIECGYKTKTKTLTPHIVNFSISAPRNQPS
jgi:hypothetical protein